MDLRFDGKTIIVTGGGSGIGAATAEELGASGATVIVADLDQANAEGVVKAIAAKGGKAHAVKVDVAKAAEVKAMVAFAVEKTGALHGIVNNAGIGGPSAPTGSYDVDAWQNVININLSGVLWYALCHSRDREGWWRRDCQRGLHPRLGRVFGFHCLCQRQAWGFGCDKERSFGARGRRHSRQCRRTRFHPHADGDERAG